jgi:hypothetical protein
MTIAAGSLDVALNGRRVKEEGTLFEPVVTTECPPGWDINLHRCQAGFFHSPPGIEVGGPSGESLYIQLYAGNEVVGIGAGVRRPCRLSDKPRHVYFPTWPAVAPGIPPAAALGAMMEALRNLDAVELVVESFDSSWAGEAAFNPISSRAREEHVIPTDTPEPGLFASLSSGHRRQIRKGDRSGWRVDEPEAEAGRSLLMSVQELAARRAAARGSGFAVRVPQLSTLDRARGRSWGASMFAAWQDQTPLAAALVGWANRRAFYVMGGSTAAGYECGASVWLHWQIARRLADAGFVSYNLGGTSTTATTPGDPSHGLYRFKSGFGSRVVSCRSMSWLFNRTHGRVHQLGRLLGATSSLLEP